MGIDLDEFIAIVAGVGKHIAIEALKRAGFKDIVDVDDILGKPLSPVLPAYATALMVMDWASLC